MKLSNHLLILIIFSLFGVAEAKCFSEENELFSKCRHTKEGDDWCKDKYNKAYSYNDKCLSKLGEGIVDTAGKETYHVEKKLYQSKIDTLNLYIKEGNEKQVKILLKQIININERGSNGWTPLATASKNNHLEIVKLLIKNGADVNKKNGRGAASLHHASYVNNLDIVKYLLKKGANINIRDKMNSTPLHITTSYYTVGKYENLETISFLLKKDANPMLKDHLGITTLKLVQDSKDKNLLKIFTSYLPNLGLTTDSVVKNTKKPTYKYEVGHVMFTVALFCMERITNEVLVKGYEYKWQDIGKRVSGYRNKNKGVSTLFKGDLC